MEIFLNFMIILISSMLIAGVGRLIVRFARSEFTALIFGAPIMMFMISAAKVLEERIVWLMPLSIPVTAFSLLNMWWTCRDWSEAAARRDRDAIPKWY